MFIEVKLIIHNAPLTPNTIKTFNIQSLVVWQTVIMLSAVRNLTVLSSTTNKINRISKHFWHRWRYLYVVNLRETQRGSKLNINSQKVMLC